MSNIDNIDQQQQSQQQQQLISTSGNYRSAIGPRHTVISRRSSSQHMHHQHQQQQQQQQQPLVTTMTTTTTTTTTINNNNNNIANSTVNTSSANNQFSSLTLHSPISLRQHGPASAVAAMPMANANASNSSNSAMLSTRHKEKLELGELNDRFAGYVERVRYLEAQNKKLLVELDVLKARVGHESKQIEAMYQIELEEARGVVADCSRVQRQVQQRLEHSELELSESKRRFDELESRLAADKQRMSDLVAHIAGNEAEMGLMRRRLDDARDEERRCKLETQRLAGEITRVTYELESEMKQRLSLENDKQSLEEELLFLRDMHAKEIDEIKSASWRQEAANANANQLQPVGGGDPAMFFRSELATAIKRIRDDYDAFNRAQRTELEGTFRVKCQELQRRGASSSATSAAAAAAEAGETVSREQARRLKLQLHETKRSVYELKVKNAELETRIADLQEEIRREESETGALVKLKEREALELGESVNQMLVDCDELVAAKCDLEDEIKTYRKLLEGEEDKYMQQQQNRKNYIP